MTHIDSSFIDAQNIIIKDGQPIFYYTGNSYLEKLKNGISLDTILGFESYCLSFYEPKPILKEKEREEDILVESSNTIDNYEYTEKYDKVSFPKERKGKWNHIKNLHNKQFKKNRNKQLGYSDKLFDREQLTLEEESEEYDYDDNISCNSWDNWDEISCHLDYSRTVPSWYYYKYDAIRV